MAESCETTDVIVIGCGPTGALLTALLGSFAVRNVVLEKEAVITEDPRGIALDEDGIRMLQAVGIYDKVYTEIGSCMGYVNFIAGKNDLYTTPFMMLNLNTTEGGTGHVGGIGHRQPVMEKHLRLAASRHACSQLRVSCTAIGIWEDVDWVYCRYLDASGAERSIRGRFLVGADGKTGFTRKNYLEPRGVTLERDSRFFYEESWVALNWRITPPTQETHPEFPLWEKGYSPEDVYDLFFPTGFRFICDPARPAVCGRFGNGAERLFRLEFVVKKEEDPWQMATREKTKEIWLPYMTHRGSRYGLSVANVHFPEDCIEVLRSKPFKFSARTCNRWSLGRTILVGDAAHVLPPFGGQGIASGFRDASGLAWRLKIACRENMSGYEKLLDGWYCERKQQLDKSLAATIVNGRLCTEANTWVFAFIKLLLRIIQLFPAGRHWLELGPRREGMTRYQWQDGLPFLPTFHGGISLPQVYCSAVDSDSKELPVKFTDDVIFQPDKEGLFQIVVLLRSLSELDEARQDLFGVEKLPERYVIASEATFIVQNPETRNFPGIGTDVFRLATAEEFTFRGSLCNGRPIPQFYDMHRMKKALGGKRFAVVRPDRFLYAACDAAEDLEHICKGIQDTLGIR